MYVYAISKPSYITPLPYPPMWKGKTFTIISQVSFQNHHLFLSLSLPFENLLLKMKLNNHKI